MKVLIVFNHPYSGSYCSAILDAVMVGLKKGNHEVDLIHLDEDNFDPVMRAKDLKAFAGAKYNTQNNFEAIDSQVMNYKNKLETAEHLIMIFPIWWELMPAMTKGFIDKVIFPGISYDYIDGGNRMKNRLPLLKGLSIITTMNTPSLIYQIVFGNAIKYAIMRGTFWKIGIRNRNWISFNMVKFVSDQKRKKWLTSMETKFSMLK